MKRYRLCLLVAIMVLGACATDTKDPTAGMSAQQIYEEAKAFADSVQYDKAIPYFDKVEGLAAGTVLAEQATLDKAYAQFRNGDQVQALATLDQFMRLHPNHPATDYVIYLKGVVSYTQSPTLFDKFVKIELAERDMAAAQNAFVIFKELVTRFPNSKYSTEARERMAYIAESLMISELKVAYFYFNKGAYVAAVNRAQQLIQDFPQHPRVEQALELLVRSYDKLGLKDLRDDSLRVLRQNFPDNALSKSVFLDGPPASANIPAKAAEPKANKPESGAKPWYRFW